MSLLPYGNTIMVRPISLEEAKGYGFTLVAKSEQDKYLFSKDDEQVEYRRNQDKKYKDDPDENGMNFGFRVLSNETCRYYPELVIYGYHDPLVYNGQVFHFVEPDEITAIATYKEE